MTKRMNRGNRQGVLHYITINVRDKKPAFAHDVYARAALLQLRRHCDEHPAKLIAYGAMPEHLHAVVNPHDGDINEFLAQYKPAVTDAVVEVARQRGQQHLLDWLMTPEGHWQLWQEGKHNLHLYSDWMIWQKINYIHNNPLKRRLVQHVGDYPYTSFCAWYGDREKAIIPIDYDWWWEDVALQLS